MERAGIFRTTVRIANLSHSERQQTLTETIVDEESQLTWIPRTLLESLGIVAERRQLVISAGRHVEREIGFAFIRAGGRETADIVVFADAGDEVCLGARSLSGLNLKVDVARNTFVDAGPIIAALLLAS
jgi:predicted aspartyl protease